MNLHKVKNLFHATKYHLIEWNSKKTLCGVPINAYGSSFYKKDDETREDVCSVCIKKEKENEN